MIEDVELKDGVHVLLEPMSDDDGARLVRFHGTLSSETTYLRYFSVHPELSPAEVDRFTHVDHIDREAMVAVHDGEIVGVGRYDRLPDGTAEVAFVVSDAWQGRGVGSALYRALERRAIDEGITELVAETLAHNRGMLAVFHRSGRPVRSTIADGVVHLVIDLTTTAPTPHAADAADAADERSHAGGAEGPSS